MDAATHGRRMSSLLREARFFRLASLVLAGAVVVQAVTLAVSGLSPKRVVVVPAEVRSEFWVEEGRVSRSYYLEWGYFIASLVLNVTPQSVDYQNEVLMRHVAVRHRDGIRTGLAAAAARLKEEGLSTFFGVGEVHVDQEGGRVAFTGTLSSYVEGRKVGERDAAYSAAFVVEGARLQLVSFLETDVEDVFEPLQ